MSDYNDHIARLQEQRDSVAREVAAMREDQETRYRETQLRETYKVCKRDDENKVSKENRELYEKIGENMLNTQTPIKIQLSSFAELTILAIIGFTIFMLLR